MRSKGWKILAVAGGLALAWFVAEAATSTRRVPPVVFEEGRTEGSIAMQASPGPRLPEPLPERPIARSVLEQYWGDEWSEIEEALLAEGADLDRPFDLAPWERVEEELREKVVEFSEETKESWVDTHVKWPSENVFEWLGEEFRRPEGFTESDMYELASVVDPINEELTGLAWHYVDEVSAAMKVLWSQGRFVRAPLSTAGAPSPYSDNSFLTRTMASETGWSITVSLDRDEFSDVLAIQHDMRALRKKRERAIRRFFQDFESR